MAQIKTGKVLIGSKDVLAKTCRRLPREAVQSLIPEAFRKKINDMLPEGQDIHLPEGGGPKQDLSPSRSSGWSLYPGLCSWHREDVRVPGVNITEIFSLALGRVMLLLSEHLPCVREFTCCQRLKSWCVIS